MNERFNLAAIIEELEEQKKMIVSAGQSVKLEEIDTDEVKMKVIVVKLKLMEELEEIQRMLSDFDDKTQKMISASQDDLQESAEAAKTMVAKAEDKMAGIVKK